MSQQPYTVVVGVSPTSGSTTALTWALAQARQNDGRVVAVRAWRVPAPQATPSGTPASRISHEADVERDAQTALDADVASALGAGHLVETRLLRGGRSAVLVEAATGADLLVIDAPRRLVTGPVFASRLIYAASCPVVVMPPVLSLEPPSALRRVAGALGRRVVAAAGTAGRPGYRPPLVR